MNGINTSSVSIVVSADVLQSLWHEMCIRVIRWDILSIYYKWCIKLSCAGHLSVTDGYINLIIQFFNWIDVRRRRLRLHDLWAILQQPLRISWVCLDKIWNFLKCLKYRTILMIMPSMRSDSTSILCKLQFPETSVSWNSISRNKEQFPK